jgi:hypothetical protein
MDEGGAYDKWQCGCTGWWWYEQGYLRQVTWVRSGVLMTSMDSFVT